MLNKVTLENSTRHRLKTAMAVLFVYVVVLAVCLGILVSVNNKNYNGQTTQYEGVVESVKTSNDTVMLKLADNTTWFSTKPIADDFADWQTLEGKFVKLFVPAKQFGRGAPIVLGLCVEDETVVDAAKTIDDMYKSNRTATVAIAIVLGVVGAIIAVLFIWRINVPTHKEYPLAEKYVAFYEQKQPNCPQYAILVRAVLIWSAVMVALALATACINGAAKSVFVTNIVLCSVMGALLVAGVIAFVLLKRWIVKKDVQFHEEKFPFDFADLSHIKMKRAYAEALQAEIAAELAAHPDDFGDGGNGYVARFTQRGVSLFVPEWFDSYQPLSAEEIFGDAQEPRPAMTLEYSTLNFEAMAICTKKHPLFVVIKSRLPDGDYPKELVNDLHFLLDVHLLQTLNKFDVQVENLDYILQNKRLIMTEKLFAKRKK